MTVQIHYIGHSAFFIENSEAGILIDPFISHNPNAVYNIPDHKIIDILVTHGHADHLGDAIPISVKTGAKITTIVELAAYCAQKGAKADGVNLGGWINLSGARVKFMPAFHTSSTPEGDYAGVPSSVLIEIEGTKIYHAGDTCLNSEMKVIGECYKPDVALLPIGSYYTMDIKDAAIAAKWLNAETIIPMHYNTFPLINTNVEKFCYMISEEGKSCVLLKPGEVFSI